MKNKIFYINSTHWDREWYLTFQGFRFDLANMINELIEIMENDPDYKLFCLDGQTIVLEDYAEVEPKNAKRLKKLIEDGRIMVGPWYVMPDEFLVSGESLIRNLARGHKLSEKWGGKPLKYGYVNDIFGHIAQMPQIFAGFDIHGAYLGRGVGSTDFRNCVWKSPDGTECYTSIDWYGRFFRYAKKIDAENPDFVKQVKGYVDSILDTSVVPVAILSFTDDHRHPSAGTPAMMELIGKMYPDCEVIDAPPSFMAAELEKYRDELPVVEGELIKSREAMSGSNANMTVIQNCLSSYYPLKQANDRIQNLLEMQTEPMLAYSEIEGNHINHNFVEVAYKNLIENHPHDSICGCSADRVHKNMVYRFDQAEEIAERLFGRFYQFENNVYKKEGSGSEYEVKIYNNQMTEQSGYREIKIDFYKGFSARKTGYAGFEPINNFAILDENGEEIPYQIISVKTDVSKINPAVFQGVDLYDVYTVGLNVSVPSCGYTTFKVVPKEERALYKDCLNSGINWAENDLIKLEINQNGTLNILDKRTNKTYTGLNEFADGGEIGEGWHYQKPANDFSVSGYGSNVTVRKLTEGLAEVKFKISKTIRVPAYLDGKTLLRSEEEKDLNIEYTVTLMKDSPEVKIETKIENNAKDHRLRVMFPTDTEGENYFAGQAFYCAERKTGFDKDTLTWQELDQAERNMNGIVFKRNSEGNGLAFVSPEGLHEAAVWDDESNTMAVTLFRCFDRVFLQYHAQLSQLQQEMTFCYSLVPLTSQDTYADLLGVQHRLAGTDMQYSKRVLDGEGKFEKKSYLSLDNKNIAISVFKVAENKGGYVLRVFNTTCEAQEAKISAFFDYGEAYLCNMNEEIISEENELDLTFRPWEIKTLYFKK